MFNFKSVVCGMFAVALLGVSTAQAADEPLQRAVKVYCNDVSKTMAKINGTMVVTWMDEDENIWVTFKDKKSQIVMGVVPSDNRKEMCIVSYGTQINKPKISS
jgi:hypothetical protein